MNEKQNEAEPRPLLHEPAMAKVAAGKCGIFATFIRAMAEQAHSTNAGIASMTLGFVEKDEPVDAEFVPEITVTVRTLES